MGEEVRLVARPHGIVLAPPLARALVLAAAGTVLLVVGWPLAPLGAVPCAAAAGVAVRAVWRWERTRVLVTSDRLLVVSGTFRRRTVGVSLARVARVDVQQSLLGRLLDYGTLAVGDLEIPHVPGPREFARLVG
jgi:membrane protein YdbS with pleckstrin-like domain